MSAIALKLQQTLASLDPADATLLKSLVDDALALVKCLPRLLGTRQCPRVDSHSKFERSAAQKQRLHARRQRPTSAASSNSGKSQKAKTMPARRYKRRSMSWENEHGARCAVAVPIHREAPPCQHHVGKKPSVVFGYVRCEVQRSIAPAYEGGVALSLPTGTARRCAQSSQSRQHAIATWQCGAAWEFRAPRHFGKRFRSLPVTVRSRPVRTPE